MGIEFANKVADNFIIEPEENIFKSIFQQYEKVIVESIITSFGLDFIVSDHLGGDVDTIHNVREAAKEGSELTYKNEQNAKAFQNHSLYDKDVSREYHSDERYIAKNAKVSEARKAGTLEDAYTGKLMARNEKSNLDHVISAKEIHDDPGRILAGINGIDLANAEVNLQPTNESINKSMNKYSIDDFLTRIEKNEEDRKRRIQELRKQSVLTDKERKELHKLEKLNEINPALMHEKDEKARKAYESKIARAYYTSPNFVMDTTKAAGKLGVKMGARELLGFAFMEVWFAVKAELAQKEEEEFDLEKTYHAIALGVKRGIEKARQKYKEAIAVLGEGFIAGALSSITTTLCNVFFSTAKNTVKIIRETYASVIKALDIILFNPDDLLLGDRVKAATVVIATGASVVVGSTVSDMIEATAVAAIPVVGDIVQAFCGTLVTGILSCTLLLIIDRSSVTQNIVRKLNEVSTLSSFTQCYSKQAQYIEKYAAELLQIDADKFQEEVALYKEMTEMILKEMDEKELNKRLKEIIEYVGINIPWEGDFDEFMRNKNNRLVFQ